MWGNTRYCTSCFDLKQKEWNIPKIFLLFFFKKMNPVYIPNFFFLAIPWVSKHVPSNQNVCSKYPRWHFKKNTNHLKNPSLPTTPWPQQLWPRTPFCWFPSFRMRRSSSRRSYMARAVPRMLTMAPQTAILLASLQTSTSSWPSFSDDIPKPPWPIAENTPKNILTSWVYLQETVLDLIFNMISAKSSSHRSPQKKNSWRSFQQKSACEWPQTFSTSTQNKTPPQASFMACCFQSFPNFYLGFADIKCLEKKNKKHIIPTSWWFFATRLKIMLVKLERRFHRGRGENKKYLSCHHPVDMVPIPKGKYPMIWYVIYYE